MSAPFQTTIEQQPGLPQPRRSWAIAALSLGTALTIVDGAIATVALPTIARDLHVDASASVLVVTVYQLVLVMMLLPCSGLGDRIGLKRFYQYGQLLFTVATMLCFFAKSLPFLLAVRALQALGAAATLSMMAAMVRNIYPTRQLGRGLALNGVIASIAGALAPTVGGLILSAASWPWVFTAAAPFGVLSLWIGWRSLPDVPAIKGAYNLGGALLNMATFGLIVAGLESAVHGGPPLIAAAVIATGVGFAIWFVRYELAEERPILPLDLLANPVISLSIAGSFLAFSATMIMSLSLPFRLQHFYGFSPSEVGAVLTPMPLTMMVMLPLSGMLSDRMRPGIQGGIGMSVMIVGLLLVAFPPAHPGFLDFAWRMILCGIGFALYMPANTRLVIRMTPHHRATAAGGLISTVRLTGQTVGATMVATFLALGLGNTAVPVLVAAVFGVFAGVFSVSRLRIMPARSGQAMPVELPEL